MRSLHTSLRRLGTIYIVAAIFQIPWLIMIQTHWQSVQKFMAVMYLWWVFWLIIGGMLWLIPHLAIIGIKLIQIGRDHSIRIGQSGRDMAKMRWIRNLLLLGIAADLIAIPLAWWSSDEGLTILLFLLVGSRVLWVNGEAVISYHFR